MISHSTNYNVNVNVSKFKIAMHSIFVKVHLLQDGELWYVMWRVIIIIITDSADVSV